MFPYLPNASLPRMILRLLAVSGYSDEGTMATFAAEGFGGALAKPFQRRELAAKLEALLGRQPAPQG